MNSENETKPSKKLREKSYHALARLRVYSHSRFWASDDQAEKKYSGPQNNSAARKGIDDHGLIVAAKCTWRARMLHGKALNE